VDELRLEQSKALRRADATEAARVASRSTQALHDLDALAAEAADARAALRHPALVELFPEVARMGATAAGMGAHGETAEGAVAGAGASDGGVSGAAGAAAGECSAVLDGVRLSHFALGDEISRGFGWRTLTATPASQTAAVSLPLFAHGEVALSELQMPPSKAFQDIQAKLTALRSPLLPASPCFYDPDAPHVTYALSHAPRDATLGAVLAMEGPREAVGSGGGGGEGSGGESGGGAPGVSDALLSSVRSRCRAVLSCLSALHRLGIAHGNLRPDAVVTDAQGDVARLIHIGFPRGGDGGVYAAPELHNQPANGGAWPLAGEAWAAGVLMLEIMCGQAPRWGGAERRFVSAETGEPLAPPPGSRDG
jgi:hypothetical protein